MNVLPTPRRTGRRWVAIGAVVALLVLALGAQVTALTGSAFEATDGNLLSSGGKDWDNAPNLKKAVDKPTGQTDDSFGQGSKEDDETPTVVAGSIPNNKSDLTRFYVANEKAGGKDFLYLAWERAQDPTGTTNIDFEFNQSGTVSGNGVTYLRTAGDVLITYGIDRGGTTVTIEQRTWTGTEWGPAADLSSSGTGEGWFNESVVQDPIAPDAPRSLSVRTFGEAAIDLTTSGLFPAGRCVSFGSAFAKSRSSDSFPAELKDFIAPIPVSVSNCGTVAVKKDTVPDDAQDFGFTTTGTGLQAFTLDDDGSDANTLPSSRTFTNLLPGSYSVSETATQGFDLTDLSCTATNGSSGSRSQQETNRADIGVTAGGTVECTFTNTRQPAVVKVIKHVVNDDGGTAEASDFTLLVDDPGTNPPSFAGSESGTDVTVDPGEYTVTEPGTLLGYAVSYSQDCSGTVAPGQTKTCTVTNDDVAPKLTVIKHVVNDNGGTADASDFTMDVDAQDASPASFPGSESGTDVTLKAGSYEVTESGPEGYVAAFSADCTGTIGVGETRTCTVTNDDAPPGLTVVKHVVNDNGGTKVAADFTIHVDGTAVDPASFAGSENGTKVSLDAGSYEVTEDEVAGYKASYSEDCTGSVALGETKVCTITNDDVQPKLKVVKHVVNDDGGTAEASDFTMTVDGQDADPASFPGKEAGTNVALNAGSYEVTEGGPDGYVGSFSEDCSGTIAVGETRTCTVTNDDAPPGLTVVKHVVNDNGGTKEAGDFSIAVEGSSPSPSSFSGSEEGTKVSLHAGGYEVTEEEADGYRATYSEDCSGTIRLGEAKVCTITNDDVQPRLVVVKHVVNDNGGSNVATDFTMTVAGQDADPASFAGQEAGTTVSLNAGPFQVSESGPGGYVGTYSGDCSGVIAVGETRTCTVTNNDAPPGLTVVKHVVNDNGGTKVAGDFTINVSGNAASPAWFAGSEAGTKVDLLAGAYEVTEVAADGYAATLSADCKGSIAVGQAKVCTITNDDVQPKLVVVKHVVNNDGGSGAAGDFTMIVNAAGGPTRTFPGSEDGTTIAVNAGPYGVDEGATNGYEKTLGAACTGTLALGQTVTCTITNDDTVQVLGQFLLPKTGLGIAALVTAALALLAGGWMALGYARRRARRA